MVVSAGRRVADRGQPLGGPGEPAAGIDHQIGPHLGGRAGFIRAAVTAAQPDAGHRIPAGVGQQADGLAPLQHLHLVQGHDPGPCLPLDELAAGTEQPDR
jgi:hypothetical protein